MKEKHPYMSGSGGLVKAVNQLRKAFPAKVTAETLKKLGIAPNNETYVINILRFISVIDSDGKKTDEAASVFAKHADDEFQKAFSDLVKKAYADLFNLHGEDAWSLSSDDLISYFRTTDQTSAIVGQRQAGTFQTLSALGGKAPATAPRAAPKGTNAKPKVVKSAPTSNATSSRSPKPKGEQSSPLDVGLTVRIEINLPASGDQETYDRIFASIRKNFLNA